MRDRRTLEILSIAGIGLFYLTVALFVVRYNTPVDYPVYFMAAYGFLNGENVYAWSNEDFARIAAILNFHRYAPPYPYPPLTAFITLPSLFIPYPAGLFAWTMLNGLAVVITGILLANLADTTSGRMLIRISVWLFVPFLVSLYAGQVNPLVVCLAAISFLAFRKMRDAMGSWFLSLSLLLKPLVVGLVGYLLWRIRWKALVWLAVFSAAILAVIALTFGPYSLDFLGRSTGWPMRTYPPAQNLPSLAARWLTAHPYGFSLADNPTAARWVGLMLAALLAAATLLLCWPPGNPSVWSDAQLGLILAAIPLVNARTWYHHYSVMAIPVAILLSRSKGKSRRWWALTAFGYGLMAVFGVGWHTFVGITPLLDAATTGSLIIWGLLAYEVWREKQSTL